MTHIRHAVRTLENLLKLWMLLLSVKGLLRRSKYTATCMSGLDNQRLLELEAIQKRCCGQYFSSITAYRHIDWWASRHVYVSKDYNTRLSVSYTTGRQLFLLSMARVWSRPKITVIDTIVENIKTGERQGLSNDEIRQIISQKHKSVFLKKVISVAYGTFLITIVINNNDCSLNFLNIRITRQLCVRNSAILNDWLPVKHKERWCLAIINLSSSLYITHLASLNAYFVFFMTCDVCDIIQYFSCHYNFENNIFKLNIVPGARNIWHHDS